MIQEGSRQNAHLGAYGGGHSVGQGRAPVACQELRHVPFGSVPITPDQVLPITPDRTKKWETFDGRLLPITPDKVLPMSPDRTIS
jgi:hypothetical protein